MNDGPGPRRYLIAAVVADYPKNRDWNRPGLVRARESVVELFTGTLGYHHHDSVPLNPTKLQLAAALRAFCTSPERREDDLLTVYLSCHGEILDDGEEHVLLTADTDPDDLTFTALPTAELTRAMLRGTRTRRVMLLLDACYVGQGGNQLAAAALERLGATWGRSTGSGLIVLSSAQPHQPAVAGRFPQLLTDAVTDLSVAGHGPGTLSVNAVVQHMNNSADRPGHQRIGLAMVGLDGEPPAFFPNPRHDTRLNEVDLAQQQVAAFAEQDRRRETEFTSRLLVRAMGYHSRADAAAWWFSGRHTALGDLAAWLKTPAGDDPSACRVVTAAPGSGKTAVLGLVAALAHPERRRTVPFDALGLPPDLVAVGAVDAAVYAQRLTDADVLDALCAAARIRADSVGKLLEALEGRPRPLTVLVDALDEAATPDTLCGTVLRPLIEHARGRLRLLLGTRPYLLPRLGTAADQVLDLDSPRYADPEALAVYAARNLLEAHPGSPYLHDPGYLRPVAEAVAEAAGHSFLIARITAGTLAAAPDIPNPWSQGWRASLPRHAGDAMREDLHRRLGDDARRATDLLRPLAYAQGQGLPWEDVWAPLASTVSGRRYTDEDLLWLRREAGSYVVEATEYGRSAYRLYHEAMAEHLRDGTAPEAVHAAYARVLTARVPYRTDGTRDWSRAHPYALHHLAHHAARAGLLDEALADTDYLVHATPAGLAPHLHHARADPARLTAAVYRTGIHLHREAAPDERRRILALDAARAGAEDLHGELVSRIPPGEWAPVWATGSGFDPSLRGTFSGHEDSVFAVACAVVDGRPVVASGGGDALVRLWDLATGQPVGRPLAGHDGAVTALSCALMDGHQVAVSGGMDKTVRVWDLATGVAVGGPFTGYSGRVGALACAVLGGRAVVVCGGTDGSVVALDLATGVAVGGPFTGCSGEVGALACAVLGGRAVVVRGGMDGSIVVLDLATGQLVGGPFGCHDNAVTALYCTVVDGISVVVSGSADKTVRMWNLATGQLIGGPFTGHDEMVDTVVYAELDGGAVVVSGGSGGTVQVWDPATGQEIVRPLMGHNSRVTAVVCVELDGEAMLVSSSWDGTVRVWDLTERRNLGQPLTGHTHDVVAVGCAEAGGRPVVISGSRGGSIRVRDLATGRQLGPPRAGSGRDIKLAFGVVEGRPVVVVSGDDTGMVRMRDLETGRELGEPLVSHIDSASAVACGMVEDRLSMVIGDLSGLVRVNDLITGRRIGKPLTGSLGDAVAVALGVVEGRPAVASGDYTGMVRLRDLDTGRALGEPIFVHAAAVMGMNCALVDGRSVMVTGGLDHRVRLWDLDRRSLLAEIVIEGPCAVCFTADGDLVVSSNNDVALYRRRPS
ncbi:WD40 repeat domain-containing protein [Kitasatospora sp. NPDC001527]|uniref:WD40 repeat domain-containing protein n=1 Tax=Kitasatospora sp. NPDC001527 TaxID=3154519 RepID=UPI0033320EB7